jgi:hypothetical protein
MTSVDPSGFVTAMDNAVTDRACRDGGACGRADAQQDDDPASDHYGVP